MSGEVEQTEEDRIASEKVLKLIEDLKRMTATFDDPSLLEALKTGKKPVGFTPTSWEYILFLVLVTLIVAVFGKQ